MFIIIGSAIVFDKFPYTLNKATDKWQVVIIPDEENSTIKVEGYGSSLEEPLLVKTIPCCYF